MANARLEKLAMEQMGKMTPEQLAQVRQQMGNMAPGAMDRVREHLSQMSSKDMENIEKKMRGTDSSTFHAASSTFRARQTHAYQASLALKNEGNALFKDGNYMAACEKYERAKSNLSMFLDQESNDLIVACLLNLANCFLKLEMHSRCIEQCTEVLKSQPTNIKALFRRGQGYVGLKQLSNGFQDLKSALQLTDHSQADYEHIKKKVEEVQELLLQSEIHPIVVEEVKEEQKKEETHVEEIEVKSTKKDDQESWIDSAKMVGKLSDGELHRMCKMTGAGMTPEMIRTGVEAMEKMDPETLAKLPSLAQKLQVGESSSHQKETDYSVTSDNLESMSEVFQKNPELVKEQAEKLAKMPQEELDRLAEMSHTPSGIKMTPEMAKTAAEIFKKMNPDQLKDLPRYANQASYPQPKSHTSGRPKEPSISDMTPEMMGQMVETLNTLDEGSLRDMLVASGMCKDQETAEKMSKQMKSLTPQQTQMLIQMQQMASKGVQAARSIRTWLTSREALAVAIVILIIAIIIHKFES